VFRIRIGFYAVTSMRIRIKEAKQMRIHADPDPGQTLLCRHRKITELTSQEIHLGSFVLEFISA
jgi:hypothetical protein